MLVVKIELHSATTGKVEEIARAVIFNDGSGTVDFGNYEAKVYRRGSSNVVVRTSRVERYARLRYNVWRLVIRSLLGAFPEEKVKYVHDQCEKCASSIATGSDVFEGTASEAA